MTMFFKCTHDVTQVLPFYAARIIKTTHLLYPTKCGIDTQGTLEGGHPIFQSPTEQGRSILNSLIISPDSLLSGRSKLTTSPLYRTTFSSLQLTTKRS